MSDIPDDFAPRVPVIIRCSYEIAAWLGATPLLTPVVPLGHVLVWTTSSSPGSPGIKLVWKKVPSGVSP